MPMLLAVMQYGQIPNVGLKAAGIQRQASIWLGTRQNDFHVPSKVYITYDEKPLIARYFYVTNLSLPNLARGLRQEAGPLI